MLLRFKIIYFNVRSGKLDIMQSSINQCTWKKLTLSYLLYDRREPLQQVTEEKDLGVTFCETLKFGKHILKCVNKVNKILGIVKRSFTYMDRDIFIQLYKALTVHI